MIQIFEESRCPVWIKKKCENQEEAFNRSNEESIIYSIIVIDSLEGNFVYYIVRNKNINTELIGELLYKNIKNKEADVLVP